MPNFFGGCLRLTENKIGWHIMLIQETVKSMSIFLGVFSVLLLLSVVLYDKYGGQVIVQKDGDRFNQSTV